AAAVTAHTAQHPAETAADNHTAGTSAAMMVRTPLLHDIPAVAADISGLFHYRMFRPGNHLGTDTPQFPVMAAGTTSGKEQRRHDDDERNTENEEEHQRYRSVVPFREVGRRPSVQHFGNGRHAVHHP